MEATKKALTEVSEILQKAGWSDDSIHIGGSVINSQVAQTMLNSTKIINQQAPGETKALLDALRGEVKALIEKLPADKTDEAEPIADSLETIVKQVTAKKPDRKWYSLSAEGLLEASKFVKDFSGNIAATLLNLGKKTFGVDYALPGT